MLSTSMASTENDDTLYTTFSMPVTDAGAAAPAPSETAIVSVSPSPAFPSAITSSAVNVVSSAVIVSAAVVN